MNRRMKTLSRLSPIRIMLNVRGLQGNQDDKWAPDARASGCFWAPKKNLHEMGSKKGQREEATKDRFAAN